MTLDPAMWNMTSIMYDSTNAVWMTTCNLYRQVQDLPTFSKTSGKLCQCHLFYAVWYNLSPSPSQFLVWKLIQTIAAEKMHYRHLYLDFYTKIKTICFGSQMEKILSKITKEKKKTIKTHKFPLLLFQNFPLKIIFPTKSTIQRFPKLCILQNFQYNALVNKVPIMA